MSASAECIALNWTHRLLQLGEAHYTPQPTTPVPQPVWAARNHALLHELAWPSTLLSTQGLAALAGNALLPGSSPVATVYSGHQFGHWAGQLGDGRAHWLGEADSAMGPMEIQLKGAGPTPYSRRGDGRAVLRSSIREYLCSEAMHGLGIPTTRALCLVASPLPVQRETLETAAIVTRVAPSFLRFGHLEHFAATGQHACLRALADHVVANHLPQAQALASRWQGNVYAGLLDEVQQRTARLLAHWQAVGFCHGVMNTDNMSLLGLTLDYGPFQFMDGFDPGHICNHSDTQGRYAYARQPQVAYWNLHCLAQALLPLIGDQDMALSVLQGYKSGFPQALGDAMRAKLGLAADRAPEEQREADWTLLEDLLGLLASECVDYTIFWRRFSLAMATGWWDESSTTAWQALDELWRCTTGWQAWRNRYRTRAGNVPAACLGERMLQTNPKYVLRNHLAETAIRQATQGDFSGIEALQTVLQSPFAEHPEHASLADFAPTWASELQISCSS